jgi:hypothetical protein
MSDITPITIRIHAIIEIDLGRCFILLMHYLRSRTVELSCRCVARDLPFCKGRDTRYGRLECFVLLLLFCNLTDREVTVYVLVMVS